MDIDTLSGLALNVTNDEKIGDLSYTRFGLICHKYPGDNLGRYIFGVRKEILRNEEKNKGIIEANIVYGFAYCENIAKKTREEKDYVFFSGAEIFCVPSYLANECITERILYSSSSVTRNISDNKYRNIYGYLFDTIMYKFKAGIHVKFKSIQYHFKELSGFSEFLRKRKDHNSCQKNFIRKRLYCFIKMGALTV